VSEFTPEIGARFRGSVDNNKGKASDHRQLPRVMNNDHRTFEVSLVPEGERRATDTNPSLDLPEQGR
jgi:hypothetical protein